MVLQEATPWGVVPVGAGQAVQFGPQLVARVLLTHAAVGLVRQKLVLQAEPQAPLVHTAWVLAPAGVGQETQFPSPLPHIVVLVLGWQVPVVTVPQR